jgi:hypothetical protein
MINVNMGTYIYVNMYMMEVKIGTKVVVFNNTK